MCVFIRYPHGKKGWRAYDMENRNIFLSKDVFFCENTFPFFAVTTETQIKDCPYESLPNGCCIDDYGLLTQQQNVEPIEALDQSMASPGPPMHGPSFLANTDNVGPVETDAVGLDNAVPSTHNVGPIEA